jgi:hypothetical protein
MYDEGDTSENNGAYDDQDRVESGRAYGKLAWWEEGHDETEKHGRKTYAAYYPKSRFAFIFSRHFHFKANPPNIAASLEPVVEHPRVLAASGECQRSANINTHRLSISAVDGYSSLSIMFLSMDRSMSLCTSSSTQVWQKVARF